MDYATRQRRLSLRGPFASECSARRESEGSRARCATRLHGDLDEPTEQPQHAGASPLHGRPGQRVASRPCRRVAAPSRPGDPSPAQTLGPFYPRNAAERPANTDADLLTVDGDRVVSKGVPIFLVGRVVDRRGQPVADAVVEIWQCDANAVYHHPDGGAESERDPTLPGLRCRPHRRGR